MAQTSFFDLANAFGNSPISIQQHSLSGSGDVSSQLQGLEDSRIRDRQGLQNRYLDVLEQRTAARDRILGNIDQFGQSQLTRTESDYDNLLADTLASFQNRGLSGSTLQLPARLGVEKQKQLDIQAIEDALLRDKIGAETGFEDSIANYQERIAPELADLVGGYGGGSNSGSNLSGVSQSKQGSFATVTMGGRQTALSLRPGETPEQAVARWNSEHPDRPVSL